MQEASKNKYAQLEAGDTFYGYKVAGIYPDKIVFERDEEKIEKLLHDPAKKRLILPSNVVTRGTAPTTTHLTGTPQVEPQKDPRQETAPKVEETAKITERRPAVPDRRSTINTRSRRRPVPPTTQPTPAKE